MTPDKDKELCEKYPKIFADRHKPMTETAMCWGFCCGDGWYELIDTLCVNVQHHIDHASESRANAILKKEIYKEAQEGKWERFKHYYRHFDEQFLEAERKNIYKEIPIPDEVPQVVATQVKEKFGGLNFYYQGGDAFTDGIITLAESLSYKVCESCGALGTTRNHGNWLRTRCEKCV